MASFEDRRRFIRSAALATAGAAGLFVPRNARAIEPIQRLAGPKFKLSLAAYSYRHLLTSDPPQATLEDFLRDCAKMNLDAAELTSYFFPAAPSGEYLRQLKAVAFRLGLDISGTAVRNDFCLPPGPARQQEIDHVKRWVDYADVMGAPVIRIFSGKTRANQSVEDAHRLAVEGMEECCDYAGRHGVFLALENHGGLTETADGILALVRDVKSKWFGVNLDTGNFRTADPYGDLARIAPYALNVQVKVVVRPNGGAPTPTDYSRLAQICRDAGYRGYIVLEYEEAEDARVACPKYVDELRHAFAS